MREDGGIDVRKLFKPQLTREQQFLDLCETVKCTLKPSSVHGVGVFALRDIKKYERCYVQPNRADWLTLTYNDLKKFDDVHPEIKELILSRWPIIINGGQFMSPNFDARLIGFMNHSQDANYDIKTDCALQDIKSGEELFEDYRIMEKWFEVFPWIKM